MPKLGGLSPNRAYKMASGRTYRANAAGKVEVQHADAIEFLLSDLARVIEQLHDLTHAVGGQAFDVISIRGTSLMEFGVRASWIGRTLHNEADAASFLEATLKEVGRSYRDGVRLLPRKQTTDPSWLRVPNAPTTPPAMGVIPRMCVVLAAVDGVADPVDGQDVPQPQIGDLKTIDELAPSFRPHSLRFEPPAGYAAMNPSITRHGDRVVMVVRCVNYRLAETGLRNRLPAGEHAIRTRNFLIELDPETFAETVHGEIRLPAGWPSPLWEEVLGFEDSRLISWRGELWTISSVREQNVDGYAEQWLCRIDARTLELCEARPIVVPGPRRNEKNWMPLVDGDALRFVYGCDPTRVVDPDGRTIHESTPEIAADNFRGGSQAIPFDGGWLAAVHWTAPHPQHSSWPVYQHRFVWFDAECRLKKASSGFAFPFSAEDEFLRCYQYCAGLCWHPDERRLLISYGIKDCEAWLASVDADDIRTLLEGHCR